ncbi:septation protein SpoVG family protein [Candidatus Saccharibacteria bacterium]|nr:septation protein SpoVG family protein [Candidatus Saccharibacteria bacterium]
MRISEVNITPIKPHDGLVGFANIVIDDKWFLSSIGIHTKLGGGYRITYPTKVVGSRVMDIFHPINRETSKAVESAIVKKFNEIFERSNENDRYNQISNPNKR